MNTTDTLDIYAPDNAAVWARAVRDALDKVRPGMGEAIKFEGAFGSGILPDGTYVTTRQGAIHREGQTHFKIVDRGVGVYGHAVHREPIGAICLALCAYRRAVEGVSDGD